ncbi:PQQ-binding-like beta-propeller repeat protein [Kitasatospora sp. NPDC048286]|uniref:PQQ-binding-like beta-propeller repeat protein n=1 Tax=Kitasatospora sp. NPDC048286 TaxID=3364047 RepID=UPI00371E7FBC
MPETVTDGAPAEPTPPARPARRLVSRRKLLMGVAGLGALAAAAGVNEWVRRRNSHGPRLWETTAASGRLELSTGRQQALYVSGFDGSVRALDPRTGEIRWSHSVSTPHDADPQGGWPLAAGDGVVCVATDTHLRVLEAESGEQRWEAAAPYWSHFAGKQRPAVSGDSAFAAHGSSVRCFDLATGKPRWTGPVLYTDSLALDGGTVYAAGESTGVVALDARTGEQLWERKAAVNGPLTAHRGALFHTSEGLGGTVVTALDGPTGTVLWGSFQYGRVTCPLSAADRTVFAFGGARLHALDADTGDRRWSADVPVGSRPGPTAMIAADGGGVYADAGDDQLYAFDLATGELRWQDQSEPPGGDTGGGNPIRLAAADGTVYRSSRAGVVALGALASA